MEIKQKEIHLSARSPRVTAHCTKCARPSKNIHQYHERTMKHSIADGRLVILSIRKRRFFCASCGKPFSESLPGIDRKRSTEHFRSQLLHELASRSFSSVGRERSVAPSTLAGYVRGFAAEHTLSTDHWPDTVKLGIDEHSFRGRNLVITIANMTTKTLEKILSNDNKSTLVSYLESLPESAKQKVSEVCIDLKAMYRNAVRELLPQAKIVVDKFHVVALANKAVNEIRSVVIRDAGRKDHIRQILLKGKERLKPEQQEKLSFVFSLYRTFPSLYASWFIKEKIREMYACKTRREAEHCFDAILLLLTDESSRYLSTLRDTLSEWRPEILNYWESRTTNAFTEGVHTKIKMIKRVSFGFRNITNYVSKVFLAFQPALTAV